MLDREQLKSLALAHAIPTISSSLRSENASPQISTLCHLVHIHCRPRQLAIHAQTFISHHPSSPSAWTYLALSLHALRRHAHAAVNFRVALALARTRAPKNIPTLRLLIRVRQVSRDLTVKAPVQEGTMLVFSNYALVHRVLPIVAEGADGSRNFLAFFIIDQQHPLPVPDSLGPRKERIRKRARMLSEQLEVRGHFGLDSSEVFTTGNGQYMDIAWLRSGKCFPIQGIWGLSEEDEDEVVPIVSRLNMFPPVIGRGSSFLSELDLPNVEFNAASSHVLHVVEGRQRRQIFVDTRTNKYTSIKEVPSDGIRDVRMFGSMAEWLDPGPSYYWTADESLARSMTLVSKETVGSPENRKGAG